MEDEDEDISPEIRSKTRLGMKNQDLKSLEVNVREHIRRNSKKVVNF